MENIRFGASQICRTNRNFSFCRKALIKVRSARTVFLKEDLMIDTSTSDVAETVSIPLHSVFAFNQVFCLI